MEGYRYYQDIMFRCLDEVDLGPMEVGMKRDSEWILNMWIGWHGIYRWVASPDEGIISTAASPVYFVTDRDATNVVAIFDVEPDRTLLPWKWWRDWYIRWGEPWEEDLPWWRRPIRFYQIRRRVKPAKMWCEHLIWINGRKMRLSLEPLDV